MRKKVEINKEMESPVAYVILSTPSLYENYREVDIKKDIEDGTLVKKLEALKCLIFSIINGNKISSDILIYVIRFLVPIKDKEIKKYLLLFWELVPKYKSDGTLLNEMILVCDAYRKDLQHPNEYIRGAILKFLCKLKEPQLLEPIITPIRTCLEHRNPYVRRNAVFAIFNIYKNVSYLIPDAPNLIEKFLQNETDSSCIRNAYMMLINVDQNRAINFLKTKVTSLLDFNDVLQLAIIELIYNYCIDCYEKNVYLKYLYELLNANSPAVRFSAANTLISLSDTSTAYEYCAKCYVNLITKESDNNVRLIVLDRISSLYTKKKHGFVLQSICVDLLGILSSTGNDSIIDLDVAKKVVYLVSELLTFDQVENALNFFKKEIQRIQKRFVDAVQLKKLSASNKEVIQYHSLIIQTIRCICTRFENYHKIIIPLLISTLDTTHSSVSMEILDMVRSVIFTNTDIHEVVFNQIYHVLPHLTDGNIFRSALWILSSCINNKEQIESIVNLLKNLVEDENKTKLQSSKSSVIIGPDGTYLTQIKEDINNSDLNNNILKQFAQKFILSSIATILLKITNLYAHFNHNAESLNLLKAKSALILITLLSLVSNNTDTYSGACPDIDIERTYNIIQILTTDIDYNDKTFEEIIELSKRVVDDKKVVFKENYNNEENIVKETNWHIDFGSILSSITKKKENILEQNYLLATGSIKNTNINQYDNKVIPLTGLSDAVYAETCIRINNFDVHFDILVVNQTNDCIQNIQVELRTQGDYKVISKSTPIVLSCMKFGYLSSCLRFSSSECNIVFGSITYETSSPQRDTYTVVLDEIKLDLADVIDDNQQSHNTFNTCTTEQFSKMWQEFDWENKVSIQSHHQFNEIIHIIQQSIKMTPITDNTFNPDCDFLVSNLFIRNRFGDEAIANLSLQQYHDPYLVSGHARIRARSQAMALTIGEKFNECFKN